MFSFPDKASMSIFLHSVLSQWCREINSRGEGAICELGSFCQCTYIHWILLEWLKVVANSTNTKFVYILWLFEPGLRDFPPILYICNLASDWYADMCCCQLHIYIHREKLDKFMLPYITLLIFSWHVDFLSWRYALHDFCCSN